MWRVVSVPILINATTLSSPLQERKRERCTEEVAPGQVVAVNSMEIRLLCSKLLKANKKLFSFNLSRY